MVIHNSSSAKTGSSEKVKVCGNCRRVSFGLTKEEKVFLIEITSYNRLEAVRGWLTKKVILSMGGLGRLGLPDLEKARAISLIGSHRAYCPAAKTRVGFVEEPCFLWLPRA